MNSWYTRFANTRFVPNLIHVSKGNDVHRDGDVPAREELDEIVLELARKVGNVPAGVLADDEHLAEVALGLGVAFEAVFVSALLLADLTVPSKAL